MGLNQAGQKRRIHLHWGTWRYPVVVSGLAVLAAVGGDFAREALAYDREQVAAGELWRLVTAHVVHLGWSHLLLNLAGLWLAWYLVSSCLSLRQWLLVLAVPAASPSLAGLEGVPRVPR